MGYSGSSDDEEAASTDSITIRCAYCAATDIVSKFSLFRSKFQMQIKNVSLQDTPERLCAHMISDHSGRAPIYGLHFPDSAQFQVSTSQKFNQPVSRRARFCACKFVGQKVECGNFWEGRPRAKKPFATHTTSASRNARHTRAIHGDTFRVSCAFVSFRMRRNWYGSS